MAKFSQDPIKAADLEKFLEYVATGMVTDDKHAKLLRRLAKRTVTLSDVTVLFNSLSTRQDQMVTQLMEVVQIQDRVLAKIGATDDMFKEAQAEYERQLEMKRLEMQAAIEASKKANTEEA